MTKPILPQNRHADGSAHPAAILGSGPSLPEQLARVPKGCILFSVNLKPMTLCLPDFAVFCDDIMGPTIRDYMAETGNDLTERISILDRWSDYRLPQKHWYNGFSASLATWAALHLGCNPVLLLGMDCYRSNPTHFDGFHDVSKHAYPLENYFRAWRPALKHCPHPERIKAMGGPLVELFGEWGPDG